MKDRAAAHRYARALETALAGEGDMAQAADDLAAVAKLMAADPAVASALINPGLAAASKQALLATIEKMAGLSKPAAGFLRLLDEHRSLHLLPEAAEAFARLRDRRAGIVEAEITTAAPLSAEAAERARQTLEKQTGRKIRLSLRTDPSLIGGMIAKVGSTVYDGSVLARLEALRGQIARS
jgi:F-type H+-transporting ATPase subunit delta